MSLRDYKKIVVLTGAGVSRASGIATFRGKDGAVTQRKARPIDVDTFERDPGGAWREYMGRVETLRRAAPNPAHEALARFEEGLAPHQEFVVVTQNVDGLHQRAGSRNVIEVHGRLDRFRCHSQDCLAPYDAELVDTRSEAPPACPKCGSLVRPGVVMFGEALPQQAVSVSIALSRQADLFVAIGTSGTVLPSAGFVRMANLAGARTVWINPEPARSGRVVYREFVQGNAEDLVADFFGVESAK
jgi:NAD-dependent deacetylase